MVSNQLHSFKKAGVKQRRKYRKIEKPRVKHWWRTRKDPFETVWNEINNLLKANPEQTAKSILNRLQRLYPNKYKDNQLRTLQRRVQKWRIESIILFDDNWVNADLLKTRVLPKPLKAIKMDVDILQSDECNVIT